MIKVKPKFELGQVAATPGALAAMEERGVAASTLLTRHVQGDWGDLCDEDIEMNNQAVELGERIFSVYKLPPDGEKIWVITERDRSTTTLLLPKEY